MFNHKFLFALLTIVCLGQAGCSGGAEGGGRKTVYKVSGKVTMRGGPLIGATVAFAPKENQPVAIGKTDDAGMYTLTTYDPGDGAAKGDYSVTVMKILAATSAKAEAAHGVDAQPTSGHGAKASKASSDGNLVPAEYGDSTKTPLSFKVEEKDNTYDIEIK